MSFARIICSKAPILQLEQVMPRLLAEIARALHAELPAPMLLSQRFQQTMSLCSIGPSSTDEITRLREARVLADLLFNLLPKTLEETASQFNHKGMPGEKILRLAANNLRKIRLEPGLGLALELILDTIPHLPWTKDLTLLVSDTRLVLRAMIGKQPISGRIAIRAYRYAANQLQLSTYDQHEHWAAALRLLNELAYMHALASTDKVWARLEKAL